MSGRPRVVVLRGTAANPWDLRPWEDLASDWDVRVLVPENNAYDVTALRSVTPVPVRTAGGTLRGPAALRGALTRVVGERYLGLRAQLEGADVVHGAELGYWFSGQAAALRHELGFKFVLTVWETLPFLRAYRNVRTRPYRARVLNATDLFLATTDRAREALVLEGARPERIRVAPPGIDVGRFSAARASAPRGDGHLLLSIGRLVWEKGHQDLLRALAVLRSRGRTDVRALVVGVGPEERRLKETASDLGLDDVVEFRGWVPYDELPRIYAQASALVLGSLPVPFWEEQFGMVLVEAMAGHVPVVAAASGAIPEVVGESGTLFTPGDWLGLADALASGPLAAEPGTRRPPEPERLERYSASNAAARLGEAYRDLLA